MLEQSVIRQTMSDVGYASYLSGGIDSSVIVNILSNKVDKASTYSVCFKDKEYTSLLNKI